MAELVKFLESLPIKEFAWIFGILGIISFLAALVFIIFVFRQLLRHQNRSPWWRN